MQDSWLDAPAAAPPSREVFSISRLNREARALLERGLGSVWLEGEISNLSRPGSGHWYFSLKDAAAPGALRDFQPAQPAGCVSRVKDGAAGAGPRPGQPVRGARRVPGGGSSTSRRPAKARWRAPLRGAKSRAAGPRPVRPGRTKRFPLYPRRIGVVTSRRGRRPATFCTCCDGGSGLPVLFYPVRVQGEAAPHGIVNAVRLASGGAACDVLIVARGGGSLEDLWAFNERPWPERSTTAGFPWCGASGTKSISRSPISCADELKNNMVLQSRVDTGLAD